MFNFLLDFEFYILYNYHGQKRVSLKFGESMAKTILIADDDPNIRKMVEKILRFKGYNVIAAVNGQEALDKVQESKVDLVIVDGLMPILDGFNFSKKVRQEINPDLPIIMMTAVYRKTQYKLRSKQWGIDSYLTKPFNVKELISKIESLIGKS